MWKTAFWNEMALQIFQRLYSTNFTWPILEDFNPYNAFIRPHLDYGDKVYDRALANHPIKALSLFNIANASTVREGNFVCEVFFQKQFLETLKSKHRSRKLFALWTNWRKTTYLFQLIPKITTPYTTELLKKAKSLS